MQKYIPIIAGTAILLLIVGGFIIIQTNQSKGTANKTVPTVQKETNGTVDVPGKDTSAKLSPVPTVSEIPLTVSSPTNGATVKKSILTVSGKTAPRAEVMVNEAEIVADAKGNFSVKVTLDEGENIILVTANDAEGNFAEQELTVTYEAGQ